MCSWANNNPFPIDASLDPQIVPKPCWQRCWKIHPRRRKGWIPSPSPHSPGRPGSPPRPRAAFPAHAYSTKFSTVPILTMLGAATINKHGTKLTVLLRRSGLWPPRVSHGDTFLTTSSRAGLTRVRVTAWPAMNAAQPVLSELRCQGCVFISMVRVYNSPLTFLGFLLSFHLHRCKLVFAPLESVAM